MNQKSYFVLISVLVISIVAVFYLVFDNGKDSISKTRVQYDQMVV